MKKISEHITYREATYSWIARRYGIDNIPPPRVIRAMRKVAKEVFEPLRNFFNVPIKVNSFYRSPMVNRLVGGSPTSQHMKGEAIDIDDTYSARYGVMNRDFFCWLLNNVEFDQLIWEFGDDENPDWIHVSKKYRGKNRKMVLRAYKDKNGRIRYRKIKNYELDTLC